MILVDPVVLMIAGDSHKNSEVRRGLQPLVDFAVDRDAVALGITHLTKGTAGRDPVERLTGSLAFGAGPRLVMMAAKPLEPGLSRRLVRVKSNIGPDGDGFEYSLEQGLLNGFDGVSAQHPVWGSALHGPAQELLNSVELPTGDRRGRPSAERDAAAVFLSSILKDGPMPSQWVKKAAADAGFSWRTVVRAREDLKLSVSHVGKLGEEGHWQWALSKDLKPGDETEL
jgi:hypothetical protein